MAEIIVCVHKSSLGGFRRTVSSSSASCLPWGETTEGYVRSLLHLPQEGCQCGVRRRRPPLSVVWNEPASGSSVVSLPESFLRTTGLGTGTQGVRGGVRSRLPCLGTLVFVS